MASKLRSLKRNIKKLEALGFVLPSYVKQIRKEETASKYSQKKLMELSKFKETYKGKERIVSGKRGREIIMRERAQKASETRRKKKLFSMVDKRSIKQYFTRENQANMLDSRILQYFDQFQNRKLGAKLREIYQGAKLASGDEQAFLLNLLDAEAEVIQKLQQAIVMVSSDEEAIDECANDWLDFLTDHFPTEEQKKEIGEAEDSWSVSYDEAPWA